MAFALINNVRVENVDQSREALQSQVVANVKKAPGFVSGTWTRSADGKQGRSIMIFESEEAAKAAAERARTGPPQGAPVTFVSAEVFEVLAQA